MPCDLETNDIEFRLIKKEYDNAVFRKLINDKKITQWEKSLKCIEDLIAQFNLKAKPIAQELTAFECQKLTDGNEIPASLMAKLEDIETLSVNITTIIQKDVISLNTEWMKSWLWLTGFENPQINPFDKVKGLEGDVTLITEAIEALQGRIDDYKKVLDKTSLPQTDDKILLKTFDSLSDFRKKLVELNKKKETLNKSLKAYQEWKSQLSVEKTILNLGKFSTSDAEQICWMPQFDANNEYRLLNNEKTLPSMIAENDVMRPLAHNVPKGVKVSSEEIVKGFTPTTPLADAINTNFGNVLDIVLTNAKTINTSGLETVLTSLIPIDKGELQQSIIDNATNLLTTEKKIDTKVSLIESNNDSIEEVQKQIKKVNETMNNNNLSDEILIFSVPSRVEIASSELKKKSKREPLINTFQNEMKKLNQKNTILQREVTQLEKERENLELERIALEAKLARVEDFDCYLSKFNSTKNLLSWYATQTYPDLTKIKITKADTVYHTDWARPQKLTNKKGSNIVTYSLKTNDGKKTEMVVNDVSYKIYEKNRFWYGVGLAYVSGQKNTNVFNTTTNAFEVNPEPQQLDIIVGAKWYPFKGINQTHTRERANFTNYGNKYQYLRGNAFLNRFSVDVSLGVRYKFLRNYFVGAGYDIIPGLNIQAGVNAYFENRYQLNNGKLNQAYERLVFNKGFIAITTDMSVFTQFVKLLKPF